MPAGVKNTNTGAPSMQPVTYAEVIIPSALPKNYTWQVPANLLAAAQPGCRVEVNLGKTKKYAGIIKFLHTEKPGSFDPKEVLNVLDEERLVFDEQLGFWEWMASYYMCSEGEVMAAALPAHFKLSSETILIYNEEFGDDFSALGHDEFLVAEAVQIKKQLKLSEVQQILEAPNVYPVVNKLVNRKVCYVWEALQQTYSPKKETYILLNPSLDNDESLSRLLNEDKKLQRAEKQMELLLSYLHFIKTEGEVTKSSLLKKSGASEAQLKGLIDKKILVAEKRTVDRISFLPKNIQVDFSLSTRQAEVLDTIKKEFRKKNVCLLHGVTSSGKTHIYIKLIEEYMRAGKQVLYLLPEIALTAQIIRRLQKHFGGNIGVYHSKFSQNERVEIWNKVKSGELRVILGARSSIFLPYRQLGLVICDEEHDSSYKQYEPAPRYNGRDSAIFLASLFKAKTLLGSATPSMESYYNASTGKYGLAEILQRYGELQLPRTEIIDTRKEEITEKKRQEQPSKIILTRQLTDAINSSLGRGKQVILFQNRRGYAPYQVCTVCGWIPQCRNCDVSLTYHKFSHQLVCHYCGSKYPVVHTCPACGSDKFAQRSFGTERIEEQLQDLFPRAHIARMDLDAVRGKHAHDVLVQQFEQRKIDILVGTQMVVKGLDFENVNLVGILDANGLLHFSDFRVNENAFQLMEQVSGRAGRKNETGQVLIQTANPTHPVLQLVQQHDYKRFYETELVAREKFLYPPFTKLIHLVFRHKLKDTVNEAADRFAHSVKHRYADFTVGPAEPVIGRIRNQYLMELLLKLPRNGKLIGQCKKNLLEMTAILHQDKKFRSVTVIPDVDVM